MDWRLSGSDCKAEFPVVDLNTGSHSKVRQGVNSALTVGEEKMAVIPRQASVLRADSHSGR
jgi:hypothetical protein